MRLSPFPFPFPRTAAGGGFVAGGLAGLTLGVGAAAGVGVGVTEAIIVNTSASVVGGIAERQANEVFGYDRPNDSNTELGKTGLDALSGGIGGFVGGKIGGRRIPIPNVRREINRLRFASRRSTRATRISAATRNAEKQALFNSTVSGVVGGFKGEGISFIWNTFQAPPSNKKQEQKACVETVDSATGSRNKVCD